MDKIRIVHSPDVDHVTLYFREITPGLIHKSYKHDSIIIDLDQDEKVVSVEFCSMKNVVYPIDLSVKYGDVPSVKYGDVPSLYFSGEYDGRHALSVYFSNECFIYNRITDYMCVFMNLNNQITGLCINVYHCYH